MAGQGRLTGERPQQGVTPDSLLTLHDAGYRAVAERLGDGPLLDGELILRETRPCTSITDCMPPLPPPSRPRRPKRREPAVAG